MEHPRFKVIYGGWYQRTTLHLTEVYDLFERGASNLNLSREKLAAFQEAFGFASVTREAGYFEFVRARTADGIEVRYYEDGLYVVEMESTEDIAAAKEKLERYYTSILSPAIAYIFSLGAPTPKVLANMKTAHPVVVNVTGDTPESFKPDENAFGKIYSTLSSGGITVHKTPGYIFIVAKPGLEAIMRELAEMQIFFREFKDQLEKYLAVHRTIWEEISNVKERKLLRGKEIEPVRSKLDSYQKAISLITNRINQMGSYIRTRSAISKNADIEAHLRDLFEFKFEVLSDTLDYIKEIWKMTTDYLNSAIQNIVEIKSQAAARGIQSLQVITSIGVISGIIGYLSKSDWPKVTNLGAIYFALILALTLLINYCISSYYKNKSYTLKLGDRAEDL
ncbi:MAG: hypothetical protein JWN50_367 [Parcubacteria group bacterium]|nr:hypothetical protein [Parcubacteria group bacterium]